MNQHPVLAKIDYDQPYIDRRMTWVRAGKDQECRLLIWLPVQLDNGGWVAAVTITGLDLPTISAMPGEDPLDAFVRALGFARDVMENSEGRFLFGDREREMGGLPVSLDRGFHPDVLLGLERQAIGLADAAFKDLRGAPSQPS